MRRRELFGPLIPQEIKELVLAKYREVSLKNSCLKLFHTSLLRETRGVRNPNLQVTITHAWNVVASFRFNFCSDFQQE